MLKKTTALLALTAQAVILSVVAFAPTGVRDAGIPDDILDCCPNPPCYPDECDS